MLAGVTVSLAINQTAATLHFLLLRYALEPFLQNVKVCPYYVSRGENTAEDSRNSCQSLKQTFFANRILSLAIYHDVVLSKVNSWYHGNYNQ